MKGAEKLSKTYFNNKLVCLFVKFAILAASVLRGFTQRSYVCTDGGAVNRRRLCGRTPEG